MSPAVTLAPDEINRAILATARYLDPIVLGFEPAVELGFPRDHLNKKSTKTVIVIPGGTKASPLLFLTPELLCV